ncbi:TraB/GumN family protein [Methylopila turkensis]|uniref:GumN family protein n=1 Tax=Methylopila turkensis TaxID=1437816 RepID=A0A9W6JN68_9HYPH|nr:TraB/GumN family protein [Methylopila turkensis]GLK78920.1 GumN family protein [Methylopila turkensis]
MRHSGRAQRGFRAALVAFGLVTTTLSPASAAENAPAIPTPSPSDDANAVHAAAEIRAQGGQLEPCAGVDLVKALQASDPAGFAAFEDAARNVVNGQGLLWRVERPGGRPSYLFGTMHSTDAEAKDFDDLVIRALARSNVVAIELPGASTRRVAGELRRLVANRSYRPTGGALRLLPEHVRPDVERRIAQAGIPPGVADQLQPWYLALALSRSTCAATPKSTDTETADGRIERLAHEQGSDVVALETPLEQVEALASVPDGVAVRMLKDAAERGMKPEDVESTITGLYRTRRIGYLLAMRGPTWAGVFDVDGYADFLSAFITRRNASMLDRALPILSRGEAFLAVGALHLPGPSGLVEMIRRSGYLVTRIW